MFRLPDYSGTFRPLPVDKFVQLIKGIKTHKAADFIGTIVQAAVPDVELPRFSGQLLMVRGTIKSLQESGQIGSFRLRYGEPPMNQRTSALLMALFLDDYQGSMKQCYDRLGSFLGLFAALQASHAGTAQFKAAIRYRTPIDAARVCGVRMSLCNS